MTEEKKTKVEEAVETAKVVVEEKDNNAEIEKLANEATGEKIRDMFADNEAVALAEAALQNSEIIFEVQGETYRVRKANFQEKQTSNDVRMKKYVELLRDKDCLLEKDLRKLYKERGIDVDAIEQQIFELTSQQQGLLFDLGQAIKQNKDKVELEKYKTEIVHILSSIKGLSLEKQQLLEFSLENRVIMEVYSYLIWAIAEKKVGEKWVRLWATQNDFLNADPNELLSTVTKNGAVLITEELTLNSRI